MRDELEYTPEEYDECAGGEEQDDRIDDFHDDAPEELIEYVHLSIDRPFSLLEEPTASKYRS